MSRPLLGFEEVRRRSDNISNPSATVCNAFRHVVLCPQLLWKSECNAQQRGEVRIVVGPLHGGFQMIHRVKLCQCCVRPMTSPFHQEPTRRRCTNSRCHQLQKTRPLVSRGQGGAKPVVPNLKDSLATSVRIHVGHTVIEETPADLHSGPSSLARSVKRFVVVIFPLTRGFIFTDLSW